MLKASCSCRPSLQDYRNQENQVHRNINKLWQVEIHREKYFAMAIHQSMILLHDEAARSCMLTRLRSESLAP